MGVSGVSESSGSDTTSGLYSDIPTVVVWCVGILVIRFIISIGIVIVVTIIVVVVVVIIVVIFSLTSWSGLGSWPGVRISLD